MNKRDAFVFEVGTHQASDFCGMQEGASATIPSRPVFKNHPVHISFNQNDLNTKPLLLIDLLNLDPKSNANFMISLNGIETSDTLPMPPDMFWLLAAQVSQEIVSMQAREKLLAIELPVDALKQEKNSLAITTTGGVPVFYDWLGCGYKK